MMTMMTGAQTMFSNKTKEEQKMVEEIMTKMQNDKKFQLMDYLKYDSSLGRDQQIELGKNTSLISSSNLQISGGVKLTEFLPDKKGSQVFSEHESDENQDKMTFEQRMAKRARDEKTGRIAPREVASVLDGGKFNSQRKQMTRLEYKKVFNQNSLGGSRQQEIEQEKKLVKISKSTNSLEP